MMRISCAVRVSGSTWRSLCQAAAEHHSSPGWHGSVCLEAAARLSKSGADISAMPGVAPWVPPAIDVEVTLSESALAAIAFAAHEHGMSLEEQMRAALEAALKDYPPLEAAPSEAAAEPEPAGPRPRDLARAAAGFRRWTPARILPSGRPAANVTAALMGDPPPERAARHADAGRTNVTSSPGKAGP